MSGAFKHPLRVTGRLVWLVGELLLLGVSFVPKVLLRSDLPSFAARALWLRQGCRRVLRIFHAEIQCYGPIPTNGLLVSNHLSYLDILVLSTLTPTVFIAKRQVKSWPIFGWFALLGGTLFADRDRRHQVAQLNQQLGALLDAGALVVLFPEGTSSNGQTVLPFKSSLLEPVVGSNHPLAVGLISYQLEDGDPGEEVCYWRDMTLVPHLINLLAKRHVQASVRFFQSAQKNMRRKELATQLHAAMLRLKETHSCPKGVETSHSIALSFAQ